MKCFPDDYDDDVDFYKQSLIFTSVLQGPLLPPWVVSYLITPRAFHDQSDLQTITFVKGYK